MLDSSASSTSTILGSSSFSGSTAGDGTFFETGSGKATLFASGQGGAFLTGSGTSTIVFSGSGGFLFQAHPTGAATLVAIGTGNVVYGGTSVSATGEGTQVFAQSEGYMTGQVRAGVSSVGAFAGDLIVASALIATGAPVLPDGLGAASSASMVSGGPVALAARTQRTAAGGPPSQTRTIRVHVSNRSIEANTGFDIIKADGDSGGVPVSTEIRPDALGITGTLRFMSSTPPKTLWFCTDASGDLIVQLLGSNITITIDGWFASAPTQLSLIVTLNGRILTSGITSLEQAMASYQIANPGFDPAAANRFPSDPGVVVALAAGWQPTSAPALRPPPARSPVARSTRPATVGDQPRGRVASARPGSPAGSRPRPPSSAQCGQPSAITGSTSSRPLTRDAIAREATAVANTPRSPQAMTRLIPLLLILLSVPPAYAVTRGGTLVFARAIDSQYLDPVHTAQNADIWISLNIYDTLLQPTPDGKSVQPGLASAYEIAPDGKSITLTLRPGLKFADGSPLLASDVAWSLNRASAKGPGGEFQFLLAAVTGVEAKDDTTVIITLSRPDPSILQALATFNAGIMPEKLMMAEPGKDLEEKSKSFAEHPIGSGPFSMQSWKRNTEMVLVRNPHYWRKGADDKALPYLDAVKFVIIPEDATRILKLKAAEIDVAEFVPYARVTELKADPKLNMVLFPAAQMNYFAFNTRPTLKDGTKNPLNDVRVRQALNYATNKPAMIQVVSYGAGTPARSFMPMSTPMAYGESPLYPYDMAKAKAMLAEAGYAQGFEITCMALAGSADDAAKLVSLQQMWAPLGVKLKIEQLEAATRLARYNAADFQMRTSLWTNDINDAGQVTSIFAYYATRQNNRSGWQDPKVDQLFEESRAEMDTAKRTAMFKEIQQRYAEAAPILFSMEVPYPVAMLKKVQGFVQIPLGNNMFVEASLEK